MAVVIAKTPAYWAPGHLILPDQPGQPLVFKFKLRFRRLNEDERKEVDGHINAAQEHMRAISRAIIDGKPIPSHPADQFSDKKLLDIVLVDWSGFLEEDGGIAIYTPAARAQATRDNPGLEAAMARAYLESRDPSQDLAEAEKNSEALPATT